jgi:hypothetical protein
MRLRRAFSGNISMVCKLGLLFLFVVLGQSARGQVAPRGDAIGGGAIASTNAASPAVVARTNSTAAISTNAAGEIVVGFSTLSGYPMQVPDNLISNTNQPDWADKQVNAMIPASVKALDGKRVRIEGFMMPTIWDRKSGKVSDFLLLANQISCCYGGPTQVHEFVTIHVNGNPVKSNMDDTLPVSGVLRVGAVRENGQLVGVYRLETEHLDVPRADR